jgi:hypothetical protein
MVSTAFGHATLVEEITLRQAAGDKSFATLVQLLENDEGETLVRVCYSTGGVARRGPVTFRAADVRRLAKLLAKAPRLRAVIEESPG